MIVLDNATIIDISQPIDTTSAVFPGDTPFSKEVTLTHEESQTINLSQFTMSPHVGTHADAPLHVKGDFEDNADTGIGHVELNPYIGDAVVIDAAPFRGMINRGPIEDILKKFDPFPKRVLIKTLTQVHHHMFLDRYAHCSPGLIDYLAEKGVCLIGVDTPSVDHITSKALESHHALINHNMVWLENLDLSQAQEGRYQLVALPLKLMELEASPVRAVLIDQN